MRFSAHTRLSPIASWLLSTTLAMACAGEVSVPVVDADADGSPAMDDCNDRDPEVSPDADERCDGKDNDCDGSIDEQGAVGETIWYRDADGDGWGTANTSVSACDAPPEYAAKAGDCDDSDARFHPGAAEDDCADPSDYNCDGSSPTEDADGDGVAACVDCDDSSATGALCTSGCGDFFVDADGDGRGDATAPAQRCVLGAGLARTGDDCDDSPQTGATCSEGCTTFFRDNDGDGWGDAAAARTACAKPDGFVETAGDCDDSNPKCTQDCTDGDADGVCVEHDCDDSAGTGAACFNACQTVYPDRDGDGHGAMQAETRCSRPAGWFTEGTDCDDDPGTGPACHSGCTRMARDADGDGYGDDATFRAVCGAPAGWVTRGGDCAPEDPGCFTNCGDRDGDGVCADADCDDSRVTGAACFEDCQTVYPDRDRDGFGGPLAREACAPGPWDTLQSEDCDDEPSTGEGCHAGCVTVYADQDGDGAGDPNHPDTVCARPPGFVDNASDCAPTNPLCALDCTDADGDGACVDQDCDDRPGSGETCAQTCLTYFLDADDDGRGDVSQPQVSCRRPEGYVLNDSDCAPSNPRCGSDCTDVDRDGACVGYDCDDAADSGPACFEGCGTFYLDTDGDGYGSAAAPVLACEASQRAVANDLDCAPRNPRCGTDCTDADGDGVCVDQDCDDHPETGASCSDGCETFYVDADGDGFGEMGRDDVTRCAAPAGYAAAGGDCAPQNAKCTTDCTDADGDGVCVTFDCDDTPETGADCEAECSDFYADTDDDGWGDTSTRRPACTQPSGYVSAAGDCDVDNPNCDIDCTDADADGVCVNHDCDDAAETGGGCSDNCSAYYSDQDNDGSGDPAGMRSACAQPAGYVTNAKDCAPDNAACNLDCTDADTDGACVTHDCDDTPETGTSCATGCRTYYRDQDNDTAGDGSQPRVACTQPAGYVANADDCAPQNNQCVLDCTDADGDGVCVTYDCDDDPSSGTTCAGGCNTYYRDGDNDGYGDPADTLNACTQPGGFVANDDDCDPDRSRCTLDCTNQDGDEACAPFDCDDNPDTGASCYEGCTSWYADSDGDGGGDINSSVSRCSAPNGYVGNADDCDDGRPYCRTSCVDADGDQHCTDFDCDDDPTTGLLCHDNCNLYQADADNDGYTDHADAVFACFAPDGYRPPAIPDCYDQNYQAQPGQSLYFAVDRGDGSFDYNCDSVEEKELFLFTGSCTGGLGACVENVGYSAIPENCGEAGFYITGCQSSGFSCEAIGYDRTLKCR